MAYMRLTMDGTIYHVRIVYDSYTETFELIEGPLAGDMESGRHERDLRGSASTYEMAIEPDESYPEDYDALWSALRSCEDHWVTVKDNNSSLSYRAQVQSGSRTYAGKLGGVQRWKGISVRFVPFAPQRSPS